MKFICPYWIRMNMTLAEKIKQLPKISLSQMGIPAAGYGILAPMTKMKEKE